MAGITEKEILMQEESLTQAMRQMGIGAFDRIFVNDVMFTGITGEVSGKTGLVTEITRGTGECDTAAAQGKRS